MLAIYVTWEYGMTEITLTCNTKEEITLIWDNFNLLRVKLKQVKY